MKAISILSLLAVAATTLAGPASAKVVQVGQSHIPKLVHQFVHPLDIHSTKMADGSVRKMNPGVIKGFDPQPDPPAGIAKGGSH